MPPEHLPFGAPLASYDAQAARLLAAHAAAHPQAIDLIHHHHPRFLDEKVRWLPRDVTAAEIAAAPFDLDDARLVVARTYAYLDWRTLCDHLALIGDPASSVGRFEQAVEHVVSGDVEALGNLLQQHPSLVHERSVRVTCFDPPVHGAMLLHYLAANGVEGHRQRTPPRAVEVARLLLTAGSDPNALAHLYGGECTTMSLLVSSSHPAVAGLQVALVDILADFGASVEPSGSGTWTSPLMTALVFGYIGAARALVRRGARIHTLAAAAGLADITRMHELLALANEEERLRALAVATFNGHVEAARLLLESGVDPSRYHPDGFHSHATPLHHAASQGNVAMTELLLAHGASPGIRDTLYHATPLGWAEYGNADATANLLRPLTPA